MRSPIGGRQDQIAGVHVGVGEEAEAFELFGVEEVGFVEGERDTTAAFVFFGRL